MNSLTPFLEPPTLFQRRKAVSEGFFMKCVLAIVFLFILLGPLQAADEATPASAIHIRDGFSVERIYSVPRSEGSWVAMCFDDVGRLYISDQGPRLFRVTPPGPADSAECQVELVSKEWGNSQGMTFINGALYVVQHGEPDTILRLQDTNGDDELDTMERLFEFSPVPDRFKAWREHGLHAIVPGPDGNSFYVVSGDRNQLPCEKGRTPKHWNRDSWGQNYAQDPYSGGWVMRADLDFKNVEYICMGLRNCYDIAFNRHGDLLTFDSDLEFDIGLPNYRPCAIRQILSGTDSGWGGRGGAMGWSWTPKWEDIQPPVKNIGPGSPTGVCFGYGAKFPARYQEAFFACDWSYGRMFAVHLTPQGASYSADVETFLSAQGLPIADLAVSPQDGALYFLIGGRGTQSGLYRVIYRGPQSTAPAAPVAPDQATVALRTLRRELEAYHGPDHPQGLAVAWANIGHPDRAIRGAARVALEWRPVNEWKQRALREEDPRIALQALLALARCTDEDQTVQPALLAALERFQFSQLGADEQCWYLRIITVSAIRHGAYPAEIAAGLVARLEPSLPSNDRRVNEELVEMCAALHSKRFIIPTLNLLEKSRTQEQQVLLAQALTRSASSADLTPALRERFFRLAIERVPNWKGGSKVKPTRERTMKAIIDMLSDDQREEFAQLIATAEKPPAIVPVTSRSFVKDWKLEDLAPQLEAGLKRERDLENGRTLFTATTCIACHNFRGEGGLSGPDLSSVGRRYSPRDLLDNILNPNKVINEQYGMLRYLMLDGRLITGRTVNMVGDTLMVATNPTDPGSEVRIRSQEIENISPSNVSIMPQGLLNTLTQEDVLDLLAYLIVSEDSREINGDRSIQGK